MYELGEGKECRDGWGVRNKWEDIKKLGLRQEKWNHDFQMNSQLHLPEIACENYKS